MIPTRSSEPSPVGERRERSYDAEFSRRAGSSPLPVIARSFGAVLWERRSVVAGVLLLGAIASPLFLAQLRPDFVATAEVSVVGDAAKAVFRSTDLPAFVESAPVLTNVAKRLDLRMARDRVAALANVKAAAGSDVVSIGARAPDAGRARAVADAFADATVAEYRKLATAHYADLIRKLRTERDALRARARSLDARLRSVPRDPSTGNADDPAALSRQIADLEGRWSAANAAEKAAQSAAVALPVVATSTTAAPSAAPTGNADTYPGLAATPRPLARPTALAVAPAPSPGTARIDAIAADLAAARLRLTTSEQNTHAAQSAADRLRSDRTRAVGDYDRAAMRLKTALSYQTQAVDSIAVLHRAEVAAPALPAAAPFIVLAALVVLAALGSAMIAEALDPRIRSSRDVEKRYGKPHLGSVAAALDERLDAAQSEIERRVVVPSVIVVTSVMAGDGTSALAGSLAQRLASAGRHVLLVDTNPGQSALTPGSAPGLSLLPNFDILSYAVAARSGAPGLLSLTQPQVADTCTPDATAATFAHFRKMFDYTIVDAAVLRANTFVLNLAEAADHVLIAVRHGRKATSGDRRLRRLLEASKTSVLGVVTLDPRTIEAHGVVDSADSLRPFPVASFPRKNEMPVP